MFDEEQADDGLKGVFGYEGHGTIALLQTNEKSRKDSVFRIFGLTLNQIRHIVESTGVLNNNHQTYFKKISRTDRRSC